MKTESRYIRQVNLPQVGDSGQHNLQNARVLVIGAGGLGCAVLPYLCAAGIGSLGIVDGDKVALSNLHRQVLYTQQDVDRAKVTVAAEVLKRQNPEVVIETFNTYINGENALKILENYDIIVDATDEIAARYLINDACVLRDKPLVHASIYRFQAQIAVFNYKNGPTYRCLFPSAPLNSQSCAEAGVLGTTVGMAGMYQANEVLKVILNAGEILSGKLLLIDTLQNTQNTFQFKKNLDLTITKSSFEEAHLESIKRISFASAKAKNGVFLDVREAHELPQIHSSQVKQIPLARLKNSLSNLFAAEHIFVFCQSGKRSKTAYQFLKEQEYNNIFCLEENAAALKNLLDE